MAKKKSNQLSVINEQSPTISDETQVERVEYTIGAWKGLPHFVCAVCGFDAFFEVVMLNHLVDKHNSEMALERLVELEKDKVIPTPTPPASRALPLKSEDKADGEVFEVELVETGSTVDARGNEHKNFVIKE